MPHRVQGEPLFIHVGVAGKIHCDRLDRAAAASHGQHDPICAHRPGSGKIRRPGFSQRQGKVRNHQRPIRLTDFYKRHRQPGPHSGGSAERPGDSGEFDQACLHRRTGDKGYHRPCGHHQLAKQQNMPQPDPVRSDRGLWFCGRAHSAGARGAGHPHRAGSQNELSFPRRFVGQPGSGPGVEQ